VLCCGFVYTDIRLRIKKRKSHPFIRLLTGRKSRALHCHVPAYIFFPWCSHQGSITCAHRIKIPQGSHLPKRRDSRSNPNLFPLSAARPPACLPRASWILLKVMSPVQACESSIRCRLRSCQPSACCPLLPVEGRIHSHTSGGLDVVVVKNLRVPEERLAYFVPCFHTDPRVFIHHNLPRVDW
jgi:hypothetical protein